MQNKYNKIINKFVQKCQKEENIEGIIIFGSYVNGFFNSTSDLDFLIILNNEAKWYGRGSTIIDGITIEYFINTLNNFQNAFKRDFNNYNPVNTNMIANSKILFDKNNNVKLLQNEAAKWYKKEYEKKEINELKKLISFAEDLFLELEYSYQNNDDDFAILYFELLNRIVNLYQVYNKYAPIQKEKMNKIINDKKYQKNYKYKGKINKSLQKYFNECINTLNKESMYKNIKTFYEFVMKSIKIKNYHEYLIKNEIQ